MASKIKIEKTKKVLFYSVLILFALFIVVPLLITVFAAFKTPAQIGRDFPLMPPSSFYMKNMETAFIKGRVLMGFKNSMILVLIGIVTNTIIGTTTAYAIGRFEFRLKKYIMGLFVLGMVLPGNLTEIPRFIIISRLGFYNTLAAPSIIYASTDIIQLYIYLQFINSIPYSLDESARIDGASYFRVFRSIILPLMKPAIATLAIIKTVWIINDMYVPYLYMPSSKLRTLTTTLMDFSSSRFATWNNLSAAIILVALPPVILYVVSQKYIFAGIVAGAVKE